MLRVAVGVQSNLWKCQLYALRFEQVAYLINSRLNFSSLNQRLQLLQVEVANANAPLKVHG